MKVGIALGSNLGDRASHLAAGFDFLASLSSTRSLLRSAPLETAPVDCPPGSGAFLNAVAEIDFDGMPQELLSRLQEFERSLGRPEKRPVNAPRPLDLDILYFGDLQLNEPHLVIPHPRLVQREFVLRPLAEIRPGLILPGQTQTVQTLLQQLSPSAMNESSAKITTQWIRDAKQRGERLATLTAYDYPTAKLLDEAGIPLLLVGDSLGMVVLGYSDTTEVTMDDILHHLRAVVRAKPSALVVADLPIHSYDTPELALVNAKKLMNAGAEAVKLEGGAQRIEQVKAIIDNGIPMLGHLGMLPQAVREEGGYKIKGRVAEERERLLADAKALEAAGAFAIVLELVVPAVAAEITQAISIPTIGIGSGNVCDGEIMVVHDLLGTFPWFRPKFVKDHNELGESIRAIASVYKARVQNPA